MAQIIRRQNQNNQDDIGKYLAVGGTVAGGIAGSIVPGAGTMAGAQVGGAIGGTAAGIHDLTQANKGPMSQGVPGQSGQARAMASRLQQQTQDNLAVLSQAESQLPKLPEELRQQYAPAIIQARMLEQKNRGMA